MSDGIWRRIVRDAGLFGFEADALIEHASYYLCLLADASAIGARIDGTEVHLNDHSAGRMRDALERVAGELSRRHPSLSVSLSDTRERGRNYYRGASFQLRATAPTGASHELCDGGAVDWTATLLSNRKERLVISGLGIDRFLTLFAIA